MSDYRLILTFNSLPNVNEELHIGNGTDILFTFKFVNVRQNANEVTISPNTWEQYANLKQAFDLDYNLTGLYYVESSTLYFAVNPLTFEPQDMGSTVDVNIISEELEDTLEITDITFSDLGITDKCNEVRVEVFANKTFTEILSPVNFEVNTNQTHFNWARGSSIVVKITDNNHVFFKSISTPDLLNSGKINIT